VKFFTFESTTIWHYNCFTEIFYAAERASGEEQRSDERRKTA